MGCSPTFATSQAVGVNSPSDATLRPICAIVCMLERFNDALQFRQVVLEVRSQWHAPNRDGSVRYGFAMHPPALT